MLQLVFYRYLDIKAMGLTAKYKVTKYSKRASVNKRCEMDHYMKKALINVQSDNIRIY